MARYAKFSGRAAIQAGSYWIEPADSAKSLLDKFNRGEVVQYQITFPEGWSFKQWLAELQRVPQFDGIADVTVDQLLAEADIELANPEGWFFPDTYSYGDGRFGSGYSAPGPRADAQSARVMPGRIESLICPISPPTRR